MTPGSSPTLSLLVQAPQAVQQLRELAAVANEVKAALAGIQGLNQGGSAGSNAALARLQGEVRELRAGLQAAQMQSEMLQRQLDQQTQANIRGLAAEKAAIVDKNRVEREEARKTADAKKQAERDALGASASIGSIRLASGLSVQGGKVYAGSQDQELADLQRYIANHQEELRVRAQAALQARAMAEDEARTRALGVAQTRAIAEDEALVRRAATLQYRALSEDEARTRALGIAQVRATAEDEARARAAEARLRAEGVLQARAMAEDEVRARTAGVTQARALAENEVRVRQAGVIQYRAITDNEARERRLAAGQYRATLENEARERRLGLAQIAAAQEEEKRIRALGVVQTRALQENALFDRRVAAGVTPADAALLANGARLHLENADAAGKHREGILGLTDAQTNLRGALRGTAGALDGLWLTYSKAIIPMVAAFAAIKTIRESIQRGTEYDYTLSFTAALSDEAKKTGLGAYKEQIDQDLRDVSKTTQFSASELAKGLRVLEQTGIDASKGVKLIGTAAQAALMGETDLKTATQDLVNVMEVFKLQSEDTDTLQKNWKRAGDVIASVAKETKANFHDVAESLKGVIGVAGQYGVQLETAASVVQTLGKAGITGNKAGTFTRNLFENLYSNASTQAALVKKELGLTPFDENGNFKRDVDYLTEAVQKIRALNPQAQLRAIADLFNERGAKPARELVFAFNELAESVGKFGEKKGVLADFANNLQGVAKVEWQTVAARFDDLLTNTIKGSESALVSLAKTLQTAFADPELESALKRVINYVASLGESAAKVLESLGKIANQGFNHLDKAQVGEANVLSFGDKIYQFVADKIGKERADAIFPAHDYIQSRVKDVLSADATRQVEKVSRQQREAGVGRVDEDYNVDLTRQRREYENFKLSPENLPRSTANAAQDLNSVLERLFPQVIQRESGGKQFDKEGKPLTSFAGAIGISQIMPETAPEAAKLAGLPYDRKMLETNPEYNAALGKAYLKKQLEDFDNDPRKALAAYNAGPGATRKAVDKASEKGEDFLQYLPTETQKYVPAILSRSGVVGAPQPGQAPGNTLSQRVMDPEGYRNAQALDRAEAAEADAQLKRSRSLTEKKAQLELQELERLQRSKLISEEQYESSVEKLNKERLAGEIEDTKTSIEAMQKEKEQLDKPADKAAVQTRINNAIFKLQELNLTAAASDRAADQRLAGIAKKAQDSLQLEAVSTEKIIAKLREHEALGREQATQQLKNRLKPEVDAAADSAALDTRKRFLDKMLEVEAQIREHEEKAAIARAQGADVEAARELRIIDVLDQRKQKVQELGAAEEKRNADQARRLKEEERSFSFGWDEAFQKYQDSATNAAQQAREAFGSLTKNMEDAIFQFEQTGKFSFKRFTQSVLADLERIAAKKASAGLMDLFGGLLKAGINAIGGGGIDLSGTTPHAANLGFAPGAFAQEHTGGIVGLEASGYSLVHPSVFHGAPRFHGGGLVGDERPIIARKGEGVFTPEQMRALSPARGGDTIQISITVNAETGATQTSSQGSNARDMKELGERMADVARAVILKEQRPKGLLAK
jgi:TP901 family phage tail tape measure protein/lambda family phage tail tape measure protein